MATERQILVLRVISRSLRVGPAPKLLEIAAAIGTHSFRVPFNEVNALCSEGLLRRPFRGSKCLRVTNAGFALLGEVPPPYQGFDETQREKLVSLPHGARPVPVAPGEIAFVDPEDEARALDRSWHVSIKPDGSMYARSACIVGDSFGTKTISLHRFILEAPLGAIIDHRNGNGLDNRRLNLREATHAQNTGNARKVNGLLKGRGTPFKGVRQEGKGTWTSVCARKVSYGYPTAEAAAEAYDAMARERFGEFACVNFPRPGERGCLQERE